MKLLNSEMLYSFCKKNIRAKKYIDSWVETVKRSEWKNTHDIKNTFNKADFISNNRIIFNIKGNEFRLIVKVIFLRGNVHIDWIGKHSDYDKLKLK